MAQQQSYTAVIDLPGGAAFAARETQLNKEISRINNSLISRGFKPFQHEIINKSNSRATVKFYFF